MLVSNENILEENICKKDDLNNILEKFVNTNAKLLCVMIQENKKH